MDEMLEKLGATIMNALPGVGHRLRVAYGELTSPRNPPTWSRSPTFLRDDAACQFISIIDGTAVDCPDREQRFDVVYHLLSPRLNQRLRLKTMTDEVTPVPSLIGVFRGADWYERETFDLYGVLFTTRPSG